jgi:RsmE family RNA methyltransferase
VNLIILEERDRHGERFVLDDARANHIREVLRAREGQRVRVGMLDGPLGSGQVVSSTDDAVTLECHFDDVIPPRPSLDLVLAVPRPKSLRKLLPEVAAFGVDRIILLRTWRVAKPFLSVSLLRPEQYRPLLREGMMQGRHTHEPHVLIEPLFKPFVEDRAGAMFADATHRIVAHPGVDKSIAALRIRPEDRVVSVIGPEGGLVPYEVEAFEAQGFEPVRMGPTPLRVETACVAMMAQLELLRMSGEQ